MFRPAEDPPVFPTAANHNYHTQRLWLLV